jgi:hypothetical protein
MLKLTKMYKNYKNYKINFKIDLNNYNTSLMFLYKKNRIIFN